MARDLLAPYGVLRAAINYGNAVLARYDEATGQVSGVACDIARELARRLGAEVSFLPYDGAGKIVAAAAREAWDITFMAVDPQREREIAYTAPYLRIEGAYCVRVDSPFTDPASLDVPGVRIAVGKDAAYDLYLTRALRSAALVRYPTSDDVVPGMLADGLEAGAGILQAIAAACASEPSLRVMARPFMEIQQAMAVPRAKAAAVSFLDAELVELRRSGFIAARLEAWGEDPGLALRA